MAERPVFVPNLSGKSLVLEMPIAFKWHPGMAASQKRKNVEALHEAAHSRGLTYLLEVSSKSDREIGRRLSAFHQKVRLKDGLLVPLECAFQGSKVFEDGGPYNDLYYIDPRDAKRDNRLKESGNLTRFDFEGEIFPLCPKSVFYDWLYVNAILPERAWLQRLFKVDGFTDIEFNPEKSINCQARSCAFFVALERRGKLDEAISGFDKFAELQNGIGF
ncbi:DarT1-associated NADAR antitoxin family protein [Sphingomonas oligophenolica]|uniref:Uncharacterized protein n=1 Tax=Sphingomonas oligophenolica TaxID=301154 RepID=A0A502CLP8_9SPHN|nr:hypothetical protein [Sphingomonas oligophenolica]TPG13682.1 hypothetical protein EAH84_05765 [Sphingomonas oligophenolica]